MLWRLKPILYMFSLFNPYKSWDIAIIPLVVHIKPFWLRTFWHTNHVRIRHGNPGHVLPVNNHQSVHAIPVSYQRCRVWALNSRLPWLPSLFFYRTGGSSPKTREGTFRDIPVISSQELRPSNDLTTSI